MKKIKKQVIEIIKEIFEKKLINYLLITISIIASLLLIFSKNFSFTITLILKSYFYLFLPGYLLVLLYFKKDFSSPLEKILLALVLSIIIVPFFLALVNILFEIPLTSNSMFLLVSFLILAFIIQLSFKIKNKND